VLKAKGRCGRAKGNKICEELLPVLDIQITIMILIMTKKWADNDLAIAKLWANLIDRDW